LQTALAKQRSPNSARQTGLVKQRSQTAPTKKHPQVEKM
jgi:hypothetical protein